MLKKQYLYKKNPATISYQQKEKGPLCPEYNLELCHAHNSLTHNSVLGTG